MAEAVSRLGPCWETYSIAINFLLDSSQGQGLNQFEWALPTLTELVIGAMESHSVGVRFNRRSQFHCPGCAKKSFVLRLRFA